MVVVDLRREEFEHALRRLSAWGVNNAAGCSSDEGVRMISVFTISFFASLRSSLPVTSGPK